jgi:hypothetical protein
MPAMLQLAEVCQRRKKGFVFMVFKMTCAFAASMVVWAISKTRKGRKMAESGGKSYKLINIA